ncbi:hypothetical protein ACIRBX_06090 [Kitasatospora sp. NPDC096147]|uniref:DUF7878 domain-containing protein n=1 Tax=Kitasatospora sp. NPDC096147 TaxID=3364093 RepID=UPI0037FF2A4D
MYLHCGRLTAPDLARRGLTFATAPVEVLLTDVEARFALADGERVLWEEAAFPVAELADALASWLAGPEPAAFRFDSCFDRPGALGLTPTAAGWQAHSCYAPELRTAPVSWAALAAEAHRFVGAVRDGLATVGAHLPVAEGLR